MDSSKEAHRKLKAVRRLFSDVRVRRFWLLGLAAVFVHTVLDPLVTYAVVAVFDVGVESNPWLAGYLDQGGWAFAMIHLPLYGFVAVVLCAYTYLFSIASEQEATRLHQLSLLAWSGILLWGLIVVGHNLGVLLNGL